MEEGETEEEAARMAEAAAAVVAMVGEGTEAAAKGPVD